MKIVGYEPSQDDNLSNQSIRRSRFVKHVEALEFKQNFKAISNQQESIYLISFFVLKLVASFFSQIICITLYIYIPLDLN